MRRLRVALILFLVFGLSSVGLCADAQIFFRDAAIYTDSQSNHEVHRSIVNGIRQIAPRFVFHVGDLVEDGYSRQQWDIFNEITRDLRREAEFYPALGNHERNSPLYFANFELPNNEHWYSKDIDGLHAIVLDSNWPLEAGTEQYAWLEEDLANLGEETKFIIALFHHPLITRGSHYPDEHAVKKDLIPLFEEYKVDAVFNGHNHSYERAYDRGVYYIVVGSSGGPLRDAVRKDHRNRVYLKKHCFCAVSIINDALVVEVLDAQLNRLDYFEIKAKKRTPQPSSAFGSRPIKKVEFLLNL